MWSSIVPINGNSMLFNFRNDKKNERMSNRFLLWFIHLEWILYCDFVWKMNVNPVSVFIRYILLSLSLTPKIPHTQEQISDLYPIRENQI